MTERQHSELAPKGRAKGGKAHAARPRVKPQVAEEVAKAMLRQHDERRAAFSATVAVADDIHHTGSWRTYHLEDVSTLLGGVTVVGSIKSDLEAHAILHRGLPREALTSLVEKLHSIAFIEISEALGMSQRTLQRHKSAPVEFLDVQQSGRAWKFAEVLAKATRALGSQDEAEQWLKRPAIGLDQQRPIDLLTTPAGVKLVEDYLGRLEYDVYT